MEKVIQEFRVIETEDGFRIEIKGDKEKMKKFMKGPRRFHSRRRHRRGHFGWGPWMWMHGAPWCGPWEFEDEGEAEEAGEES